MRHRPPSLTDASARDQQPLPLVGARQGFRLSGHAIEDA
jgi:hypothetical protein